MSQEDALRLLQKYGKANDNMRLLKELLVKSSSEIAHQDQEKKQLFEKISGLEFEVRTLKTANSRERENHREELAVVSSQFADLKSEYAGMSKVAAEREVLIERRASAEDRRKVRVYIAAAGRALVADLLAEAKRHEADILTGYGPEEQALLKKVLRHLIGHCGAREEAQRQAKAGG